ncbi:amelogenin [Amia ocellicauda]|uniref:amelogenin n=1 Tax=Amia ocellicauda TaxID=2972642 RepID=UPI003464A6DC
MQTVGVFVCLVSACLAIPVYRQQVGLSTSYSHEFLHFNGMTYRGAGIGPGQAGPFIPPFVFPQQPDVGLPSQLPLNPSVTVQEQGPLPPHVILPTHVFVPSQGNLPPQVQFPPSQQDLMPLNPQLPSGPQLPLPPQDPNVPQQPQNPSQMGPQYFPSVAFPQQPGQGIPYYFTYGYAQQMPPSVIQPTQSTAQQNLAQATPSPQLPPQETLGQGTPAPDTGLATAAPAQNRGDTKTGNEEGLPGFSFLFEP